MKTVFGPVNSRRFGNSLGIDLSPAIKQCNFDCLYCELSPSVTVNSQKYVVKVSEIIEQLKERLNDDIDVITITANGEPTLYPFLEELIDEINKIKGSTETLILSNSAMLINKNVFDSLLKLEGVKLSLDAISEDIFKKVDRPHTDIRIDEITQKILDFSNIYKGKLYIEILFIHNLNDTKKEIRKLNDFLLKLSNVTRIDIGTIDRPPAYQVEGVSYDRLHEISLLLDPSLPVHIASRAKSKPYPNFYDEDAIVNTLDKRPLTIDDIELLFDQKSKETLQKLLDEKKVVKTRITNIEFLIPVKNTDRKRYK